jgi:dienelactone hydrolase
MKTNKSAIAALLVLAIPAAAFGAMGSSVTYEVEGKPCEGYCVSPSAGAPFVLLIHDRDGLTGHEVKRASMLADLGCAVFAADLFGAGVRPTEVKNKR